MIIVIDSREKKPYQFPGETIIKKLDAGDYSILGYESKIAIERKSKIDAYGTIGKGRKRFIRELERLESYEYKAIIIESSVKQFLIQPKRSQLNPNSVINSLLAWSVRYKLPIFFGDDRYISKGIVYRLLEKFYKEKMKGV